MDWRDIPKSTISLVSDFPNEYTGRIVKMALAAMQPDPQQLAKALEKLSTEKNIPKNELYEVLGVYIALIRLFSHVTDKDFVNTLTDLGFSNEFIERLPFVNNRKELIDTFFTPHYKYFKNVSSVKWRIDISLLHSTLGTKTLPNTILSIKMMNGKHYTIELNAKAFHTMRFNIALVLKEIKSLRQNNTLNKMIK